MFLRQISKFRTITPTPSTLTQNLISKAEHLSNSVVFLASAHSQVHPEKINLIQSRSFHSQVGLTLNYREKFELGEDGGDHQSGFNRERGDRYGGNDRYDRDDRHGRGDRYGGAGNKFGGSRNRGWYEEESDIRPRRNAGSENFGNRLSKKDWQSKGLTEVKKDLYKPAESVLNRSDEEIEAFRKSSNISIMRGQKIVPKPILKFEEAGFPLEIMKILENTDFSAPMPIQSQGWPIALSGIDLVGIGQTGSGKTLGFVLPAIVHIRAQPKIKRGEGPIALVIAPTRELAQQIQKVVEIYSRSSGIRSVCLFGGVSRNPQINELQRGVDMVIATPGRLIDLLEAECTDLERCSYVVLDEADRCLDMGFEPQLRKILGQVRPDRQMLMWSATWPTEVRALARDFFTTEMNDGQGYIHLNIGSTELQVNHNISQNILVMEQGKKVSRLLDLLRIIRNEGEAEEEEGVPVKKKLGKILIFAETKRAVDFLERMIEREGHRVAGIHGDKSQLQRDRALEQFRNGRTPILVATDVASRGLDVDDVKVVINFDYPNQVEDYIHRIGRTGRRDRQGTAYTFITDDNAKQAGDLIKVLQEAKQEIPVELLELNQANQSYGSSKYGRPRSYSESSSNRYNKSYRFQDMRSVERRPPRLWNNED